MLLLLLPVACHLSPDTRHQRLLLFVPRISCAFAVSMGVLFVLSVLCVLFLLRVARALVLLVVVVCAVVTVIVDAAVVVVVLRGVLRVVLWLILLLLRSRCLTLCRSRIPSQISGAFAASETVLCVKFQTN